LPLNSWYIHCTWYMDKCLWSEWLGVQCCWMGLTQHKLLLIQGKFW
jgi:hypothetical protein